MTFKNKIKEHSKTRPENWGIASLKLSLKLEMEEGDACYVRKHDTKGTTVRCHLCFRESTFFKNCSQEMLKLSTRETQLESLIIRRNTRKFSAYP